MSKQLEDVEKPEEKNNQHIFIPGRRVAVDRNALEKAEDTEDPKEAEDVNACIKKVLNSNGPINGAHDPKRIEHRVILVGCKGLSSRWHRMKAQPNTYCWI
jgi:hypothetical protein